MASVIRITPEQVRSAAVKIGKRLVKLPIFLTVFKEK